MLLFSQSLGIRLFASAHPLSSCTYFRLKQALIFAKDAKNRTFRKYPIYYDIGSCSKFLTGKHKMRILVVTINSNYVTDEAESIELYNEFFTYMSSGTVHVIWNIVHVRFLMLYYIPDSIHVQIRVFHIDYSPCSNV